MNVIPALEMKSWRTSASDCTGNQIVVKYEFISTETFRCRLCNRRVQRRGCRQLTVVDTPYMQYDIALIIDEKYLGRDKKFVACVIDGSSGEILWLKEGKGHQAWMVSSEV